MPTTTTSIDEVNAALQQLTAAMYKEGVQVNLDSVYHGLLAKAIDEEYQSGQLGTVYEIIVDLDETVGLEIFGLVFH